MSQLTPMMKQYMDIKERYSDCILFFRLGDFYEMFFEDAITASRELEITLTARECGLEEKAPMCGIPHHSSDNYISKLVEKNYKVAICEQVEDPLVANGIVKRDVARVVTPGTITDTTKIDDKTNNYLLGIYAEKTGIGLTYVDITTGEISATHITGNINSIITKVIDEIGKIEPKEIISNGLIKDDIFSSIYMRIKDNVRILDDWYFDKELSEKNILIQFKSKSLSSLGLEKDKYNTISTGFLLEYLQTTQKKLIEHITKLYIYNTESYMAIDINTRKNLELLETMRNKKKKGSLLGILDKTSTAMGGRLIKKWIEEPLIKKEEIIKRQNMIEVLVDNIDISDKLEEDLKSVYDIERLLGKIAYGNCNGRDLISLKISIGQLPRIKSTLEKTENSAISNLKDKIDLLEDIFDTIESSIVEDPPITIKEGHVIKEDFNKELKELRDISLNGKDYLTKIELRERKRLGIKNLKIRYNKVFGYFIELSKSNIDKAPKDYERKQTLANAERYITGELKEIENKILGSEEKMIDLEYKIFLEVREKIKKETIRIQETAKLVSEIDVINSLSKVAYQNNYSKPKIVENGVLKISEGRHPVVEKMVEEGSFISNDTDLDIEQNRIMVITGPNMAGKSTYMRQVALITLMAQMGSFIPADNGEIAVADKIFTRIGASDDLSEGQSTFMVEMSEVANILNNATKNSLIVLDEIGRGTSTYDGLSIAWAVLEYISDVKKIGAKTLFATHYHELTELEEKIIGVKNYKVKVKDVENEDIVFLRKIEKGKADRSYGIEVAKLAGVRLEVVENAYNILKELEDKEEKEKNDISQISLFGNTKVNKNNKTSNEETEILKELKSIDIMKLTPMDAMNKLYSLLEKVKNKG